ncbi:S-protein homolog 29-like [Papaver somniferum]|uniref:S-protein homolog 29-like n=1 Tax=Papaver somniferum TaxID=3469 RepID=UPI000E6FE47D|nr:S-protein homolog 29-like [Papaver somniferum]
MSSYLVSGSVAAIFFTLLTLSLCCARSVDVESWADHKKTVIVENDIGPNIVLALHCWSSEDDFGVHTLNHKENFKWRFKVNWKGTTKFVCESGWYDSGESPGYQEKFTAFKSSRDWSANCEDDCWWSIRRDGGYYGDAIASDKYPPKKMFSYHK